MTTQRRCQEEIAAIFKNFGSHPRLQIIKLADLPGNSKCLLLDRVPP
jgi:hypothetical protein